MDINFLVATGTILKEYMNSRKITQKKLARILDSSERHISNLINGKAKLSEEIAIKLEKVFPDIKAEFWLDIEKNYRLNLLRQEKQISDEIRNISKDYQFDYVFEGLNYNIVKQAKEMLRLLSANSFEEVEKRLANLNYSFMEDGGNKKAIYVWLKMCEYELDLQNNLDLISNFDLEGLKKNMSILKMLIYTTDFELAVKNIRKFLNNFGIAFVILDAVPTSKVRGATSMINKKPVIFLSTRYKMLDTFYFTLIHELVHIINGDINDQYCIIFDDNNAEILSNTGARNFFVDKDEYQKFCSKFDENSNVADEVLMIFSSKQKVVIDIVIGFLEHDGIIKNRSRFYYLRNSIK